MVYGFAKQSGGHIAVYSEEGLGTTVTLYLHPSKDDDVSAMIPVTHETPQSQNETILVVEDDPQVRRLTVRRLDQLGYRVLEAQNGPAAIEMLRTHDRIDLVLSDVVMPGGMTGFEVADQALEINPALKVLLSTGYASGGDERRGEGGARYRILGKPYSLHDLARTLREVLE